MTIQDTPFEGLKIINPRVFPDKRGYFYEAYNKKSFEELNIFTEFHQDNVSKSQKHVLRGLHFQHPPHAQAKLVSVISGAVLDVVVDLRKRSSTYGKYYSVNLDNQNKNMLLVPEGFAHGFITLEDNTIFSYKCSTIYCPDSDDTILWNDLTLGINWQIENPIVSKKDISGKEFKSFKSPF